MTYAEAKLIKIVLEAEHRVASEKMASFPKGPMGLTPDAVKFSDEFRSAKVRYQAAHKALATFSKFFVKRFKAEYSKECRRSA